ncbi:uncharacterized protein LOC111274681 [Durio zibethinus]|uniref:Uncharacterized protein LOC111274681 n=1 Tax=Durio zibethinus TaxID=66656 RepID=A0A6P5WH24_DURZI|nr:uncharacterized protein LOC111274681 [Durio zibethinus]
MALLGKQGWRILRRPGSLVRQVLKAKYFPQSSFMPAKLGASSSLTRRSVRSAKRVLEMGLRWRVANRKQIRIWEDVWATTRQTLTPCGDRNIGARYYWVFDLTMLVANGRKMRLGKHSRSRKRTRFAVYKLDVMKGRTSSFGEKKRMENTR